MNKHLKHLLLLGLIFCYANFISAHCASTTAEIVSVIENFDGTYVYKLDFCAGTDGVETGVSGETGILKLLVYDANILAVTSSYTSLQTGATFSSNGINYTSNTSWVEYSNLLGDWFAEPTGPDNSNTCASISFVTNSIPSQVQLLGLETEDDTTVGCYQGRTDLVVPNLPVTLPVELISFQANASAESNELSWEVVDEKNIAYYEVNYKSFEGEEFKSLQQIPANNTSGSNRYFYSDELIPQKGYYRLKIVEEDGGYRYSKTIFLERQFENQEISVFPNPTTNELNLIINILLTSKYKIEIRDILGRKVFSKQELLPSGKNQILLNVTELNKGIYELFLIQENNQFFNKLKFMKM